MSKVNPAAPHENQWIVISIMTSLLLGILLGEATYLAIGQEPQAAAGNGTDVDRVANATLPPDTTDPPTTPTEDYPNYEDADVPDYTDSLDTPDNTTEDYEYSDTPDLPDLFTVNPFDSIDTSGTSRSPGVGSGITVVTGPTLSKPTPSARRTRRPSTAATTTPSTATVATTAPATTARPIPPNPRQKREYLPGVSEFKIGQEIQVTATLQSVSNLSQAKGWQEKFQVTILSNASDAIFINLEPWLSDDADDADDADDVDHVKCYRTSYHYGDSALIYQRLNQFPFQRRQTFTMKIRRDATAFHLTVDGQLFHVEPYPSWNPHNIDAVLIQGDLVDPPVVTDVDEEVTVPANYTRHVTNFDYRTNGDGYEFRSEFIAPIAGARESWAVRVDGTIVAYPLPQRGPADLKFSVQDQNGRNLFMVSYHCGLDPDVPYSYRMGWYNEGADIPETVPLASCPFQPATNFTLGLQRYVGSVGSVGSDQLQYSLSCGQKVTSRWLNFTRAKFPDSWVARIVVSGKLGVARIVYTNALPSLDTSGN